MCMENVNLTKLEDDIESLIRSIYLDVEKLKKDKHIPHKSRFLINDIQSKSMSLWIKVVKKQTWGAVSGEEIMGIEK